MVLYQVLSLGRLVEVLMSNDVFEQVAADKSQLGFDYQDLVCLEHLIDMRPGETIGLEVLDDVHHEKINGVKELIQVKHSVNDSGTLTNRDVDLWKTLYNWSRALDKLGNSEIEFIFFTNKRKTSQKGLVLLLDKDIKSISCIEKSISSIKEDIDSKEEAKKEGSPINPIKKFVDHIDNLTFSEKSKLFNKIRFVFSIDDIFYRLKKKIEYFSIGESKSEDVLNYLLGVYRKKKYQLIKSGEKLVIDYDLFRNGFQFDRIIKITQDRKVDFSRYHGFKNANNINPKDGVFAKQLSDIDIPSDDITDYAIEYAATSMFIQKLIIDGDFSDSEDNAINDELYSSWKKLHRRSYDSKNIEDDNEHKRIARNCLYDLEDAKIGVSNSNLSSSMVTGKSIELSDIQRVGWRKDWRNLYGKDK